MENATTVCWKCRGTGEFVWRSGEVDVCYPCEGSGRCEAPAEVKGQIVPWTPERARLTLRGFYRAAKSGTTEYTDIVGEGRDSLGWTAKGLADLLDMVPASREAFRGLGWPV